MGQHATSDRFSAARRRRPGKDRPGLRLAVRRSTVAVAAAALAAGLAGGVAISGHDTVATRRPAAVDLRRARLIALTTGGNYARYLANGSVTGGTFTPSTTCGQGESAATGATNWIDVVGFDLSVSSAYDFAAGGTGIGKPVPTVIGVTKSVDTASPSIRNCVVTARHVPAVKLTVRPPATSANAGRDLLQVVLGTATYSSQRLDTSKGASERIEIGYRTIAIGYTRQKTDGTFAATVWDCWNIAAATDVASTGSAIPSC